MSLEGRMAVFFHEKAALARVRFLPIPGYLAESPGSVDLLPEWCKGGLPRGTGVLTWAGILPPKEVLW
ncbi:hypothetical protein QT17_00910 [Thermus sp. 2.9]|nr:hypothetical protein QT17_00910 [Thermus sp. 2.9]